MTRHKHADLMIAYANDTSLAIEANDGIGWYEVDAPAWSKYMQYRIKPESKKAYVYMYNSKSLTQWVAVSSPFYSNLVESRLRILNNGYEATEIKEVVFE